MRKFIYGLSGDVADSPLKSIAEIDFSVGENTGNLAFLHAIDRLLGEPLPKYRWETSPNIINAQQRLGIIPCANQIGPHADMGWFADYLHNVQVPVLAVGLGCQGPALMDEPLAVPMGTINWLEQLVAHRPVGRRNIAVRGVYTESILKDLGFGEHVIALGCPSLHINPDPNLGGKLAARYRGRFDRIGIAAGHPEWEPMRLIERSLVHLMEATSGEYIVQADWRMLALARQERFEYFEDFTQFYRRYACPHIDPADIDRWIKRYFRAFFSVESWMEHVRHFDLIIGSRIHGVMMAIQAGIPGICIAHDSRVREICEISHIPYILASDIWSGIGRNDLYDRVQFNAEAFDLDRVRLRQAYLDFLLPDEVPTWSNHAK